MVSRSLWYEIHRAFLSLLNNFLTFSWYSLYRATTMRAQASAAARNTAIWNTKEKTSMQRRSIILAALAVGLALGIIVGPTIRSSIVSAQAQPPGSAQPVAPGGTLLNLFLDKLAGALNIQRSALD